MTVYFPRLSGQGGVRALAIRTTCLSIAAACLAAGAAQALTIPASLVVDNDFAIFSGTSTSVNTLLYQNNEPLTLQYNDQLSNPISLTIPTGDTMLYLLAMDGGTIAEAAGLINNKDITTLGASMSSLVTSYLTGYNLSTVSDGSYDASVADVNAALANLSWGSPNLGCYTACNYFSLPNSFLYDVDQARLFRFNTSDVLPTTPAPLPVAGALASLPIVRRMRRLRARIRPAAWQ
jgi:hypothetical protein